MEHPQRKYAYKVIVKHLKPMIDNEISQAITHKLSVSVIKRMILKQVENFKKTTRYPALEVFTNTGDYNTFFQEIVEELLEDRLAKINDKKIMEDKKVMVSCPTCSLMVDYLKTPEKGMGYILCPSCQTPITQREVLTTEVKTWDNFFTRLNEASITILKLEELVSGLDPVSMGYKKVLTHQFKTNIEYIDIIDKSKHQFRVNDIRGDIMNSNRVMFDVLIYNLSDLTHIQTNLVKACMEDFYRQIPENLDIFGIGLKPETYIDDHALEQHFKTHITLDETVKSIGSISGYKYEAKVDDYFIFTLNKS
jgi:Zn finger protein HypA/HybF involved in hydrogenase expression